MLARIRHRNDVIFSCGWYNAHDSKVLNLRGPLSTQTIHNQSQIIATSIKYTGWVLQLISYCNQEVQKYFN